MASSWVSGRICFSCLISPRIGDMSCIADEREAELRSVLTLTNISPISNRYD
ncbi:hypothetical protein KAZ93_00980 [Patescibacteria group bacterium]|nr:hypothetical protein [Patescibacteria group bacterium]